MRWRQYGALTENHSHESRFCRIASEPNGFSSGFRGVALGAKRSGIANFKTSAVGIAECERIARSSPGGSSKIFRNQPPSDSPRSTCYKGPRPDYRLGFCMLAAPGHANVGFVRSGGSCPAHWLDSADWHATATSAALRRDKHRCSNELKRKGNETAARTLSAGSYVHGHRHQIGRAHV